MKIHKANKEINSKNSLLRKEMERLSHEHKSEITQHLSMIETLNQQNEQLKAEIKKKSTENASMAAKMSESREDQASR